MNAFDIIMVTLILTSAIYALYNYELAKLFASNSHFLKTENKRKENNFGIDDTLVTRGPSRFGNRYEKNEEGKIIAIPEERSSLVSYI